MISRYAIDATVEGEDREIPIQAYTLGKQVGVLDTGGRSFGEVVREVHSEQLGRLLAGGFTFILKAKDGQAYVLFLEYEPGKPRFNAHTFTLSKLADLGSRGAVFVGSPYEGRGDDPAILKQLKGISDKVRLSSKK